MVIGVHVGDEEAVALRDVVAGGDEAFLEHLPGGVVVPARVHEHRAAVGLEEVDERVAEGVVRDRDGDAPQPRTHAFDRRDLVDHGVLSFARRGSVTPASGSLPHMRLRYSREAEAFRAELNRWLDEQPAAGRRR